MKHLDCVQRDVLEQAASPASLARRSCVTVMMSQPIASAWHTFNTSRGLAHSNSTSGLVLVSSNASDISGTGSRPVSAIRPAKTDTTAPGVVSSARTTVLTCGSDRMAVTFNRRPSAESSRTRASELSALVFVTGILTYTFEPQDPMRTA